MGIDYLKYDWCSAGILYHTQPEMQAAYQKMGEALRASGRPIVYGLCQYGLFDVSSWGRKVGANLWRTTGDIGDRWSSVVWNGFDHNGKLDHTGADGWNDPDDLQIGIGGITTEEYRTQMTLSSIMAAPVLVEKNNNDLVKWTPAIKDISLNKEVIAVDHDAMGKQGHRVFQQGLMEVWAKPLADGSTAVALFNRGEKEQDLLPPTPFSGQRSAWGGLKACVPSVFITRALARLATAQLRAVVAVHAVQTLHSGSPSNGPGSPS